MIGAGGLLYLLDNGIDVPGQVGLAAFNGVELLQGLSTQLATMDACRREIGQMAARIIAGRQAREETEDHVTLMPKITYGDTLRRR